MRFVLAVAVVCLVAGLATCQTQHKNGNPTGEIGQPAFDEIVVESTLTVRGKSGSRSGKSLITNRPILKPLEDNRGRTRKTVDDSVPVLRRNRRAPVQKFGGDGMPNLNHFPNFPLGAVNFPSSSSSAAQASANAFNSKTPFGNFGAAASQSSSQSQNFGPNGFQGGAGQSASQTYYLPNGNKVDVSFSNSYAVNNGQPTFANSHSVSITTPDGKVHKIYGRR